MTTALSASRAPPPSAGRPPARLTEADLSRLWEGQRFPAAALRTRDGRPLRVIYRGRRNGGPGPDFRDALIAAPEGVLKGDVELHTRSSDFRRHGHHLDPAYETVVLHLVFECDDSDETITPGGRAAPVVALADWAEARAESVRRWLTRPVQWQEPCRTAVGRLGAPAVAAALERLGSLRFRQKTAACRQRLVVEDADGAVWRGLLEALGYGGHSPALRQVAAAVPWAAVREHLRVETPRRGVSTAALRAQREVAARTLLLDALQAYGPLPGRPTRPANRPEIRLAGAARLAVRLWPEPASALFAPLALSPVEARRKLVRQLTVRGSIGASRALEVLTNVVLPLAAAADPALEALAEAVYAALPLPAPYGALRHLHQAVSGEVPPDARRQQGMLYLLRQYCTQGGCGRCPLS